MVRGGGVSRGVVWAEGWFGQEGLGRRGGGQRGPVDRGSRLAGGAGWQRGPLVRGSDGQQAVFIVSWVVLSS